MKSTGITIAVLAGGLVKDGNGWRTTGFSERDDFGVLGDRLRVVAGALLFAEANKRGEQARMIACGGKGQMFRTAPEAPSPASVIRTELMELGVPDAHITVEEKSGNTYEQLLQLQDILQDEQDCRLSLITNRYHIPRVRAFVQYAPHLAGLRKLLSGDAISFTSAEEVLLSRDARTYQAQIETAYGTKAMDERMALEQKGVEQINQGTYTYTL